MPPRAKSSGKKILVADDDRATRHLVSALLKKAKHSVATAEDGNDALRKIENGKFDLVLLDVWMPGLNGLEVLSRLAALPSAPRAIMLTTDDTPQTLLNAVRGQAYQYVHKPVDPAPFLHLVNDALARPSAARPIKVISAKPHWVELDVPCEMESAQRIDGFMTHLEADLPEAVRVAVGQAFHELLMNAVEWGGKLDPTRSVRIAYVRTQRLLMYRIADPGKGFSFENLKHSAVHNPPDQPFEHANVREEKGLRPGGFGILMTGAVVDELVYNEAQNEVLFVKYL
ncbi:MAG: response regulator [Acidobacteria bacterium]|nr:response regulator [Acidobacteriota bacterium]